MAWFSTRREIPIGALALVRDLSAFLVFRGDRADWSVTPLFAAIAGTPFELNPLLESVIAYLRDSKRPAAVARAVPSARDRSAKPKPMALGSISELLASSVSPKLFEPKPGLSVICFLRHGEPIAKGIQNAPAAEPVRIAIDGEIAVNLEARTYSEVTVDPGTHFIAATGEHHSREPLRLVTEAGAVYFVIVEAGNVTGAVTLKQTDHIAADQILSILPPATMSRKP